MTADRRFDDIVRGWDLRMRLSTDSIERPMPTAWRPRGAPDGDDGDDGDDGASSERAFAYVPELVDRPVDPAAIRFETPPGTAWRSQPHGRAPTDRFVAVRPGSSAAPLRLGPDGAYPDEFGPLAALVADADVTDVFVNGPGELWADRGEGPERQDALELDERTLRELAVRLMSAGGRHIDEATPCVDVRLHDGIRVHAVLPPISTGGTLLSIRLPRVERLALTALQASGMFGDEQRALLEGLVRDRVNVLITGAGGTGKTTLLGALLAVAPATDRIVTLEDVAELRIAHPHVVALQARQPNIERAGGLALPRLVREAMRMRPDRLVLGECRGEEVRELLTALNTGHDGGAGTLHANSLEDVPARLEALGALAGMPIEALARQAVSAIGAVVHLERADGARRVAAIGRLGLDDRDRLAVVTRI